LGGSSWILLAASLQETKNKAKKKDNKSKRVSLIKLLLTARAFCCADIP
jgi:hypothetical protein